MKELIKSFFESSNERIKNPLIGTFAISWILINWKPVIILLFSKQTIQNKIKEIEFEKLKQGIEKGGFPIPKAIFLL
ncbi:hypothetical protein [uncultured Polaribacter sp.]|uniref:hypothetical protein n=1 Tax=uncultured Polaribacter sp. TaxID=174711 RepID=UPI003703A837